MTDHTHNQELIDALANEYRKILNGSTQAMYIFLDDTLKVCNKNFSDLLGYASPEEWAAVDMNFPDAFVADESKRDLVSTYQNAMNNMEGAQTDITWKKKNGEKITKKVILVPISYKGHLFALHFIF